MTTPVAFFLVADDRPIATPWCDRILTMFSLLHQHAMRKWSDDLPNAYADLVEKAFSNLPGLAASKQRIVASRCTSLASGIHTLLASAPGAKPDKQLAFLQAQMMLPMKTAGRTQQPFEQTALTWTFYLGVVPRTAPDATGDRRLWIASVRWEPFVAPKPDLRRDACVRQAAEPSRVTAQDASCERSPTVSPIPDGEVGVLHARVLDATLHPTFFDRYAERWSRISDNAPPERIRNDAHFLFIPVND